MTIGVSIPLDFVTGDSPPVFLAVKTLIYRNTDYFTSPSFGFLDIITNGFLILRSLNKYVIKRRSIGVNNIVISKGLGTLNNSIT